jgi:hypothetical protein
MTQIVPPGVNLLLEPLPLLNPVKIWYTLPTLNLMTIREGNN